MRHRLLLESISSKKPKTKYYIFTSSKYKISVAKKRSIINEFLTVLPQRGISEMMANNGEEKVKPINNITVNPDTTVGSVYAQIVSVTVTDTDITLEFVYLNPRPPADKGQVVSRVTLPLVAGEGLAKAIIDTIRQHEAKKEKK